MDATRFRPLPHQGLHWVDQAALLVADLHLGKEATFCSGGIAVPRGSSEQTLRTVAVMLRDTRAERLWILGDLFHAKSSLAFDMRTLFVDFLHEFSGVDVTLVKGNHDRSSGPLPNDWPMTIVESPHVIDSVELSHFPDQAISNCEMRIAGHTHPAIRLRGCGEGKMACFHFDAATRCLTLPAVGKFTGTRLVRPNHQDRIWVSTGDEIIEISRGQLA
jgi:uncharacterized protein